MAQNQAKYSPPATKTVAAAGSTKTDATVLAAVFNSITGADGTVGVKFQIPLYGDPQGGYGGITPTVVYNTHATNTLLVYPQSGGTINGGSADASVNVLPGEIAVFYPLSISAWRKASGTDPAALSGVTAGTITASKAVVVDANKDITEFRKLTADELTVGGSGVGTIAAAGTNQGTGTATANFSNINVVTGADGTKGVVLPTSATGKLRLIYNSDPTNVLVIYPGASGTINGGSANASVSIPALSVAILWGTSTTNWTYVDPVDIRNAQTIVGAKTFSSTVAMVAQTNSGTITQTSASSASITSGRQGATNPGLQVDNSAGTAVGGVKVTASATTVSPSIAAISSDGNVGFNVDAKGTGKVQVGGVSTGQVSLGRGAVKVPLLSRTKTSLSAQNVAPTAAQLLGGYVLHVSATGGGTFTLDTGGNIDTAVGTDVAVGDSFTCEVQNTGNQTSTITTNTGIALKGTVAIPTLKGAVLTFVRTGSAAWDVSCQVSA